MPVPNRPCQGETGGSNHSQTGAPAWCVWTTGWAEADSKGAHMWLILVIRYVPCRCACRVKARRPPVRLRSTKTPLQLTASSQGEQTRCRLLAQTAADVMLLLRTCIQKHLSCVACCQLPGLCSCVSSASAEADIQSSTATNHPVAKVAS